MDGRSDGRQTVTIRFPLDAASVINYYITLLALSVVVALACEMFVRKNRNSSELGETKDATIRNS